MHTRPLTKFVKLGNTIAAVTSSPEGQFRNKWTPDNLCGLCEAWPSTKNVPIQRIIDHVKSCPLSTQDYTAQLTEDEGAVSKGSNLGVGRIKVQRDFTPSKCS
jgi:hypothetical protein